MLDRAYSDNGHSEFERRHAIWAELHARFGSARAYPYAWRLPELARDEGPSARFRAALALAQTLYAMGRFGEAQAALPKDEAHADACLSAEALQLHACCHALQDETDEALALAEMAQTTWPNRLEALHAQIQFLFLIDVREAGYAVGQKYLQAARLGDTEEHGAWAVLMAQWSQSTPPGRVDPVKAHTALSWLRAHAPVKAAIGEAIHAETCFRHTPAEALVWLEHALDLADKFGQHHLKARLLHLKSRSLDAAGRLAEAGRFLDLARDTARHQGAWRYLRNMAG